MASLWKVPDAETRDLMILFYQNLWQKKLGKLESLRQAQLELLREGTRRGIDTRGLKYVGSPDDQPLKRGDPLPPYYWAAFILSGDWR